MAFLLVTLVGMVAEPSWSGVRKPRASIYLWSRIAGVYVEPPLHNHNALFSASVAYRINPSPSSHFDTFYTIRNSVSPVDFVIVLINRIRSGDGDRSRDFCSRNFVIENLHVLSRE